MARLIKRTPDLTGRDAERFLDRHKNSELSPEEEKTLKSFIDVYRKYK